ncbi:MAG: ABC transporter permease [Clostridia bacterium]|nr:ABC transporter permease [Clostridia bacterium]
MNILIGVLEQGLIYAIAALGIYITYKILDFPDLTADGSFALGAALTTILILMGVNPILCIVISAIGGFLCGCITGIIHVKFKVRDLLAGIITMMALYSINLRIVGKANVSIMRETTIFDLISVGDLTVVIVMTIIVLLLKIVLDLYLKTRSGYLLKAVGNNPNVVVSLGRDDGNIKILGLALGNSLVAISGGLLCQQQGFFEITMGNGVMVMALASVIIGFSVFKNVKFISNTLKVVIGSILYKASVSFALYIGFEASDIKLITAVIFLIVLILSNGRFFDIRERRKI